MAEEASVEVIKDRQDIKNDVYLTIEGTGDGQSLIISLRAPRVADIIRKMTPANYPRADIDKALAPCMMEPPLPEELQKPYEGETETAEGKAAAKAHGERVARAKALQKANFLTRPAISKITKNIAPSATVDFAQTPPSILLCNPDALEAGFSITMKQEKPPAPELLRKWGKQLTDGIVDIVANSRPFRMTWTLTETPKQ